MAEIKTSLSQNCSLGNILSNLMSAISQELRIIDGDTFAQTLLDIYNCITYSEATPACVQKFRLDDKATSETVGHLKNKLQSLLPGGLRNLNSPITYLLDELICNIQQHAHTDAGYAFVNYNSFSDTIDITIADDGVTIYGSYVESQKYLELLSDSDAQALNLAQNGYSVKNLPNAENRGYGISSNMRMVVEGLHGEFAVFSGNALLVHLSGRKEILSLPRGIDLKGTMIIASIPAHLPEGFDFYKYIS